MTQADHIISKAGGVTALSRMLGHRHRTTVQGWEKTGYIHPRNWDGIVAAFNREGIAWRREDFIALLAEQIAEAEAAAA